MQTEMLEFALMGEVVRTLKIEPIEKKDVTELLKRFCDCGKCTKEEFLADFKEKATVTVFGKDIVGFLGSEVKEKDFSFLVLGILDKVKREFGFDRLEKHESRECSCE